MVWISKRETLNWTFNCHYLTANTIHNQNNFSLPTEYFPESQRKSKSKFGTTWGWVSINCNWYWKQAFYLDLISKPYKLKGLYFTECLHVSKPLECWTSSIRWKKQGRYCTVKIFSANRWTAMWFASAPKVTDQPKKKLISSSETILILILPSFYFRYRYEHEIVKGYTTLLWTFL